MLTGQSMDIHVVDMFRNFHLVKAALVLSHNEWQVALAALVEESAKEMPQPDCIIHMKYLFTALCTTLSRHNKRYLKMEIFYSVIFWIN